MPTFDALPLLDSLRATLRAQGLHEPTEIQARVIPALLAGHSVVGVAETGSGKTLSYALPILHLLKVLEATSPIEKPAQPRALVLVPTRELGEQVAKVMKTFTHDTRLRVRTVLGGTKMEVARRNVSGGFEVLVATPGRLGQLLERDLVGLDDVRLAVLDEADQLLDMGFLRAATDILAACPKGRQMALFSATIPAAVDALIAERFEKPVVIRSVGHHKTVATLQTDNRNVIKGRRFDLLQEILKERWEGGTLLFANTRDQCDAVVEQLRAAGHTCVLYRGEMDKVERRKNLQAFKNGEVQILVATDLGSRGLDLELVGRVINYHLPSSLENYLHRVGRTARAGRKGLVINFVTARDRPLIGQITRDL